MYNKNGHGMNKMMVQQQQLQQTQQQQMQQSQLQMQQSQLQMQQSQMQQSQMQQSQQPMQQSQQQMQQSQMQQSQQQMQQSQQQAMMMQQQQGQSHPLQQQQQMQHMQQNPMLQDQQMQAQQQMPQQAQQQAQQQQLAAQQQQQQQAQLQQEQKHDNISKVKTLSGQLNETLMDTLRMAGINLQANSQLDLGNKQGGDLSAARYEECMEKFYSICDQMELHLKTASAQQYQSSASQRHTPAMVSTNPPPDIHKYTHYTNAVRHQVAYAKEIHSILVEANSRNSGPPTTQHPPPRPQAAHHDTIAPMDAQP